jgi:ATP-dependent RNA helicase DeaD
VTGERYERGDRGPRGERSERGERGERGERHDEANEGPMTPIFVGAGRAAGIRPGDLVGAITNEAG